MNRNDALSALLGARTGGATTTKQGYLGATVMTPVEVKVEAPDLRGIDPSQIGWVSAELDNARNLEFSKVGIRVFAKTPCHPGDEKKQLDRLIGILKATAEEHEQYAYDRLTRWASENT